MSTQAAGSTAALALALVACSGGDHGLGGTTGSAWAADSTAPAHITAGQTGTFYGPVIGPYTGPNGPFDLGRSFITLRKGVPTAFGMMLFPRGVTGQPPTPISDDAPNVYFIVLPPESAVTGFRAMAVFYFSGHPIDQFRPHGEPEHFHTVFLVSPPRPPSPNLSIELKAPDPDEIPTGVSRGVPDTVVPGFGVSYDDPLKPEGQPARITIGQNYLFYDGHMNGMVVGADVDLLLEHATWTDVIPQPKIYARPGYWPRRYTVKYDEVNQVHVYQVEDFVLATQANSR